MGLIETAKQDLEMSWCVEDHDLAQTLCVQVSLAIVMAETLNRVADTLERILAELHRLNEYPEPLVVPMPSSLAEHRDGG